MCTRSWRWASTSCSGWSSRGASSGGAYGRHRDERRGLGGDRAGASGDAGQLLRRHRHPDRAALPARRRDRLERSSRARGGVQLAGDADAHRGRVVRHPAERARGAYGPGGDPVCRAVAAPRSAPGSVRGAASVHRAHRRARSRGRAGGDRAAADPDPPRLLRGLRRGLRGTLLDRGSPASGADQRAHPRARLVRLPAQRPRGAVPPRSRGALRTRPPAQF